MNSTLKYVFRGLFALALLAPATMISTAPVAAATIATTTVCSNGVDDTGGLGLICNVTVVNTISATVGYGTVTVHECHGSAGAPTAACADTTLVVTQPVTAVTQCNDSINGGGGTLRCTVQVTNNFYILSPGSTAVTVNMCVGSGGGITTGCAPFPATTTGAAITQCNGSANGGTLVGMTCTATGTMASALAVTINQCNGSANGGGALVICSANVDNNALEGAAPLAPTPPAVTAPPAAAPSSGVVRTLPPTGTLGQGTAGNDSVPPLALLFSLALGGLGLAVVVARRRSVLS
jgi:hypothetical protein